MTAPYERDLPREYARDLEQMLDRRHEVMDRRAGLGAQAWADADEALGRSVSDRLAAERDRRVALRDASHDVSAGADWRRVATNHVPFDELARRRDTAAAVERASRAVASIPTQRAQPPNRLEFSVQAWDSDDTLDL